MGEISGWYKKHLGYGQPKEGKILTGLKEEFGDLLYYIVKLGEKTGIEDMLENGFEANFILPDPTGMNYVACVAEMSGFARELVLSSEHSVEFLEAYVNLFDRLLLLINAEGFTLEDIQLSNLAKLNVRHGNKFKDSQAVPQDRDKNAENKAIDD